MKRHLTFSVFVAAAVAAIAFFASKPARLDPQGVSLIAATPQAVVIAEGGQGLSNAATVVVTNVSKEPIRANVLWNESWVNISPTTFSLDPGKSTTLKITGTFSGLRQALTPVTRENQQLDLSQRPVTGVAPVTISSGNGATVIVVVGMRFGLTK